MTWFSEYIQFIKIKCMARLQYPLDLAFSVFAFFLVQLTGPALVFGLYNAGASFEGWTMWELIFLQGVFSTVAGVAFVLFWGLTWRMNHVVRDGYFELARIRPINTLRLLVMEAFDEEDIAQLLSGLVVVSVSSMYVSVDPRGLLYAVPLAFIGLIVLFSLSVIAASTVLIFVTVPRVNEFLSSFLHLLRFPKDAFSRHISVPILSLFPLFFVNTYPTQILLGGTVQGWFYSCLSVLFFLALAMYLWRYAVSQYEGAGG